MKLSKKNILALCLFLTPLIGLGMDLYTPSLPAIANYFQVSHYAVKLTIILYLAAFGFMQPFAGIISDHVDRKYFILVVLTLYVISSFLSVFSPSIDWLYFFRVINSLCATSVAVLIKSVILDNFSGKKLAKANNCFTLSWSVTPMIAPVIGGYLQHYFDWKASFYFISFYALIGLILFFVYFEKSKNAESFDEKKILSLSSVFKKWKIVFSDRIYLSAIFILAVENAALFLYYTVAPFVIQKTLNFTAAQYGNIMLFAGLSYIVGNLINAKLLNYFKVENLVGVGLGVSIIMPLIPIAIMLFSKNHALTIDLMTLPIFIIFLCDGLIFSNITTLSLSSYAKFSGIAGGLLAGMFNLLAAMIVAICTHFFNVHNMIVLYKCYFSLFFVSCVVFVLFIKGHTTMKA